MRVSRRAAITRLGSAGAGLALAPAIIRGQSGPLVVAGQPVEMIVASLSPTTIRLTVVPLSEPARFPTMARSREARTDRP